MTTDQIDDDALAARITASLQRRAVGVVVEDRLDHILGETAPIGSPAPEPLAGRSRPAWRRPVAARVVFAVAAAVAAVALTLALWHRPGPERLAPVTGPTPGALIYPMVDLGALEASGVAPFADGVQGALAPASGPVLVLGRIDGDRVGDLLTVTLDTPADAGGDEGGGPSGTLGVASAPDQGAASLLIGERTVRLPFGVGGPTDMIVWLQPGASPDDVEAVRTLLDEALVVRSLTYVNQEATFDTFRTYYADQPEVLQGIDPSDLPTSFRVELEVDDPAIAESLAAELRVMPSVNNVSAAVQYQRYEWDEGGATIIVDSAPGSDPPVEAVIEALTVTPQPGGPPSVSVMGPLPDGMEILAGPSAHVDVPLPVIDLAYGSGGSRIIVTRQPSIDPRASHSWVTVRGRRGYLSEQDGAVTVTWPIDDDGWWARLFGSGLTNGQAVYLANAVTFTDEATWTGLYPSQPPTTFEIPPDAAVDELAPSTTTTQP